MNHGNLLEEVSSLYGYDDELKIAIGLTIPLLIEQYGVDKTEEIYNLFRNTKIFSRSDMGKSTRESIEHEMLGSVNGHIIEKEEDDLYQTNRDPGSYYSYQAVFDKDMNVTGEVRWVVVQDMKDSFRSEDYKNMFGTTVNMPYFVHEMSHAFAMQKATYRKEGDKIFSKHGMYEQVITYEEKDGKIEIDSESVNNVLVEEAINEKHTQDMLTRLMEVQDYSEVQNRLTTIGHVTTSYSPTIIALAEKFENILGKEELLKLRRNNDMSVLKEFNEKASQSDIYQKYCTDGDAYSTFDKKCFGLFLLKNKSYTMAIEEYSKRSKELMVEAFAPLCAYQDVKYGTMSLEKFDNIRAGILGIQVEINNQKTDEQNKKI